MSYWYEPKDVDIDVDREGRSVDIYLYSDKFGAVYASLSFDQIKSLYDEIFSE